MPTFWVYANKPLPQWANTALADVGKIRIVFPFTWDTPLEVESQK
jgi:hypothetical protein